MTTKHVTDDAAHEIIETASVLAADASQQAEDASRELLAKARYDAFRLMTEARDESEIILDEARSEAAGLRQAADVTATSTIDRAGIQAAEIIEAAHEEAAAIVAGGHRTAGEIGVDDNSGALKKEHRELSERVSTLRVLADQLENRFAALAETAGAEPTPQAKPSDIEPLAVEEPVQENAPSVERPANGEPAPVGSPVGSSAPVLDYSAAVAATPKAAIASEDQPEKEERESFYNRRSAKLPRIGDDGGRSAFDMTRSMRESLDSD